MSESGSNREGINFIISGNSSDFTYSYSYEHNEHSHVESSHEHDHDHDHEHNVSHNSSGGSLSSSMWDICVVSV